MGRGFRGKGRKSKGCSGGKDVTTTNHESGSNKIMKFATPTAGKKYSTFTAVRNHLAMKFQKEMTKGVDVATAIRSGKHLDFDELRPKRQRSKLKDEEDREFEQDTFNRDYGVVKKAFESRMETYQDNCFTAYGVIFDDFCTSDMQLRLEEHPDFDTKLFQDPIATIDAIKE